MSGVTVIEIETETIARTMTANDPSPEHDSSLTEIVAEYIVGRAEDAGTSDRFVIRIKPRSEDARATMIDDFRIAYFLYFDFRAKRAHREFRRTLRRGLKSLAIGLVILLACTLIGQAIDAMPIRDGLREALRDGVTVLGWVANWRPVELLFYDWWPIRAERNLFRRLTAATVERTPVTQ